MTVDGFVNLRDGRANRDVSGYGVVVCIVQVESVVCDVHTPILRSRHREEVVFIFTEDFFAFALPGFKTLEMLSVHRLNTFDSIRVH